MTGSDSGLTGGPVVPVGPPGGRKPRPQTRNSRQRSDSRFGLALISPTVVLVVVLVVLPILWTVMLAFQDLRLIRLRTAGLFGDYTLDNFVEVFTSPGFWSSLATTLVYSVGGTAASIGLGLVAALALRSPLPRAHARQGVAPAAVRGAGRGGHVRLGRHAQPSVRHRERGGHGPALGRADRLPVASAPGP